MRYLIGMIGLAAVGACTIPQDQGVRFIDTLNPSQTEAGKLVTATDRAFDEAYRDLPFDTGRVYVLANEHGDLHTYSLTPCRNGTHICGGTGHAGHVQRTADFFIVTGAYRDRTFYLSPGGDGYLTVRGVNRDLAWN